MYCKARVRVDEPNGLHLRPASRIAEAVADYPGEIRVKYRDRVADAQSVIDLLSLGVPEGGVVMIEADRFDAPAIVDQIRRLTCGLATEVA
jgi:phosphotransferase system HPr (HPr) family protein